MTASGLTSSLAPSASVSRASGLVGCVVIVVGRSLLDALLLLSPVIRRTYAGLDCVVPLSCLSGE